VLASDLEVAAAELARSGFRLTDPVPLMKPGPDGITLVPSGGRQRTIMFDRGYLEIQTIEVAASGHPLAKRARRYSGAHLLAFATRDAAATARRWSSAGLDVGQVQRWRRATSTGREAEFSFVIADEATTPAAMIIATQHHTPRRIRPPGVTNHRNGARRLVEVLVVATAVHDARDRFERLVGSAPIADGRDGIRFVGGRDSLSVGGPRWLTSRSPIPPPSQDSIAGVVLAVDDLDHFVRSLRSTAIDGGELGAVRWFRLPGSGLVVGAVLDEDVQPCASPGSPGRRIASEGSKLNLA
jgi:hypothetical protein